LEIVGTIFISQPGIIVAIKQPGSLPGSLSLPGGLSERVVITGVGHSQSAHVQFQQSLRNAIYLYSFGDRPGQTQIRGLAFAASCRQTSRSASGVEELLTYYAKNRVSATGVPIQIRIGVTPVDGFLMACSVETDRPELLSYGFNLTLATVPDSLQDPDMAPAVGGTSNTNNTTLDAGGNAVDANGNFVDPNALPLPVVDISGIGSDNSGDVSPAGGTASNPGDYAGEVDTVAQSAATDAAATS
jgi:hypothetical protein